MPVNFHSCPVPTRENSGLFGELVHYGQVLIATPAWLDTITHAEIVVVTGDTPCGHALLCLNRQHYIHIGVLFGKPRYLNTETYCKYLAEHEKTEAYRRQVHLTKVQGLKSHLSRIIESNWLWGVIPNNCYAFVEGALDAGGALGNYHKTHNCPQMSDQEFRAWMNNLRGRDIHPFAGPKF